MKQTAFIEEHRTLGGKLIDFGGWELPVQYTSVMEEHLACRTHAGLFDVSHMGEIRIQGPEAESFLNFLVTNDVSKISEGQAQYALFCREDGGVIDDLILYKLSKDDFFLVVNASNTDKDFEWLRSQFLKKHWNCTIENESRLWSQIAIQGPRAEKILSLAVERSFSDLKSLAFKRLTLKKSEWIIGRTGYTGEDGFEIYLPWEEGPELWRKLLAVGSPLGLKPCGLGARDTLRLEACLPLYGNELSETRSPLAAGLGWAVKLQKTAFLGRDAMITEKEKGSIHKLVGIQLDAAGIPRHGYKIFDSRAEKEIGIVTSGSHSPTLKKPIGLAYVETPWAKPDSSLMIEIRGTKIPGRVVSIPFYKRAKS